MAAVLAGFALTLLLGVGAIFAARLVGARVLALLHHPGPPAAEQLDAASEQLSPPPGPGEPPPEAGREGAEPEAGPGQEEIQGSAEAPAAAEVSPRPAPAHRGGEPPAEGASAEGASPSEEPGQATGAAAPPSPPAELPLVVEPADVTIRWMRLEGPDGQSLKVRGTLETRLPPGDYRLVVKVAGRPEVSGELSLGDGGLSLSCAPAKQNRVRCSSEQGSELLLEP